LNGGKRRPRFDERAAGNAGAPIGLGQGSLPYSDDRTEAWRMARPASRFRGFS
jgi:hypothetical protein